MHGNVHCAKSRSGQSSYAQETARVLGDVVSGRKGAGKRAGWRGESAKALRTGMFDFLSRLGMFNF